MRLAGQLGGEAEAAGGVGHHEVRGIEDEDDAVRLADHSNEADAPEREARDRCITELLYGSGLRLGELVGLDAQPGPQARGWIDAQAGEAHVLGKGSKRRSVPVGAAATAALAATTPATQVARSLSMDSSTPIRASSAHGRAGVPGLML